MEIKDLVSGSVELTVVLKLLDYISDKLGECIKEEKASQLLDTAKLLISDFLGNTINRVYNTVDKIFTNKQFSLKCFLRSIWSSFIFLILAHALFFTVNRISLTHQFWGDWLLFSINFIVYFLFFSIVDYFLLWKTRIILKRLSVSSKYIGAGLMLDIIITSAFAILKYLIITVILSGSPHLMYFIKYVLPLRIPPVTGTGIVAVVPGIYFYSTFFFSFFLWAYVLSLYMMPVLVKVSSLFNVKNPIIFAKLFIAIVVIFLYILVHFIILLFR